MKRAFFLPLILGGRRGHRFPKYFPATGTNFSLLDYGANDYAVIMADVTPELLQSLIQAPDVVSLPQDLDVPVGSGIFAALASSLEAMGIPVDRFDLTTSGRVFVAFVMQIFKYAGAKQALGGQKATFRLLSTQHQELSQSDRALDLATINKLKIDASVIQEKSTFRETLNLVAMQMPTKDLSLLGIPFSRDADVGRLPGAQ